MFLSAHTSKQYSQNIVSISTIICTFKNCNSMRLQRNCYHSLRLAPNAMIRSRLLSGVEALIQMDFLLELWIIYVLTMIHLPIIALIRHLVFYMGSCMLG